MNEIQRFGLGHLVILAIGLGGGYAMAAFGPPEYTFAPQLAALKDSIAVLEREKIAADSATRAWRNTVDAERAEHVMALGDTVRKYQGVAQQASASGRRQIAALSAQLRARGDTAGAQQAELVAVTITESDAACELAVSSCQQATDSLKLQVSDRDSILASRDTSLARAMRAARDGAGLAADADAARQAANRRTKVFMVLSAVLGALVIVK